MAKIVGALTGITGKCGAFIFQMNKGVQIMKTFAVPSNPNTSEQQTVRTVFRTLVACFKPLATTWIRYFWNPFTVSNGQGWGNFIGFNVDAMGSTFALPQASLSRGSLEGVYELAATYDTATGIVAGTFYGTIITNGADADKASIAVFDADSGELLGFDFATAERSDEEINITVGKGFTATDINIFVSLSSLAPGVGTLVDCSNSNQATCTAAA